MAIRAPNRLIAQREFTIDAPQQRVWDLLPKAIYQCLPLEKIDIVNERTFHADLRWNLFFLGLRFHLKGEFEDIIPLSFFTCMLAVKKGIVQLELKVTFELRSLNQKKTEILCKAVEERKGKGIKTLVKGVMKIPEKNFAGNIFDSIKIRLKQIT